VRLLAGIRATGVVLGGDKALVAGLLEDPRLAALRDLPRRELYDLPDPRLDVLDKALERGRAVRVTIECRREKRDGSMELFGTVGVLWLIAVSVAIAAMSGIYRTALYRYATEGQVPGAFADADLEHAFGLRRRGRTSSF